MRHINLYSIAADAPALVVLPPQSVHSAPCDQALQKGYGSASLRLDNRNRPHSALLTGISLRLVAAECRVECLTPSENSEGFDSFNVRPMAC